MKIGILTHYNVNNQGAQLQMYATYMQMKELGYDPAILTYNKNFDFVDNNIKKRNIITVSSIPYILKEFLFKKGIKITLFNAKKYLNGKKFRKNTFKFRSYTQENMDYTIIGADEVMSLEVGINIMMFGHCINTKKIIAYAPSCGQTNMELIESKNAKELIESGLKKINSLSARDENTKNVMEELTQNKSIPIVIDPVLLYDFSKINTKIKKIKNKYLIVYSYDKNMNNIKEIEAIKNYAKKKNLKIASIGTYHKWCDYNINCNCLEWLEYFRNAEEIITDTFHGTILSVITNKPVAVYIRNSINSNKMNFLLKQLKIQDRQINKIDSNEIDDIFSKKMDYDMVNRNLNILRNESNEFLSKNLV